MLTTLWYALIPLPPLAAALWIGLDVALRPAAGESAESATARLAASALALSLLALLVTDLAAAIAGPPGPVSLGTWISAGEIRVGLDLLLDPLALAMATVSAAVSLATLRFSVHYMHREPGFRRFFLVLSLFAGAMTLIFVAGNAVLAFAGWELAGVSSYLLIGYVRERPQASEGATRAFVANRIGDAGLLLAIALCFAWLGGTEWPRIAAGAAGLGRLEAGLILLGLMTAALAKSAALPFSGWIGRALEGPTPSSAVFYGSLMVHAGVFLLIRCQPLLERAPAFARLAVVLGIATALYGWVSGLAQSDVKSGAIFSVTGQIGLMFLWCGLGWTGLAAAHMGVHALWRIWQMLNAPAVMHWMDGPTRPLGGWLARRRLLYTAALQRFWLEPLADWLLVRPTRALAQDVRAFDDGVIDPLLGTPGELGILASVSGTAGADRATRGRGLIGGLLAAAADLLYWFEDRLILHGGGARLGALMGDLARVLLRLDELLGRPRYLLLLIMATLVVVI